MANQPLAFAELLAGGVLLTSAIKKITVTELLTNGLKGATGEAKVPGGAVEGTSNPGSGADPETESGEVTAAKNAGKTAPGPASAGGEVLKSTEKDLEKYLKRGLTSKEKSELHSLQGKGEL